MQLCRRILLSRGRVLEVSVGAWLYTVDAELVGGSQSTARLLGDTAGRDFLALGEEVVAGQTTNAQQHSFVSVVACFPVFELVWGNLAHAETACGYLFVRARFVLHLLLDVRAARCLQAVAATVGTRVVVGE